jgi:hypothetical protein
MTKHLEWDFDNPAHRRHKPRMEVLEPEEQPVLQLHVRQRPPIHHQRPKLNLLLILAAIFALFILWRFKLGLLMLGVLIGWQTIAMLLFVGVIVAIAARERLHGRTF